MIFGIRSLLDDTVDAVARSGAHTLGGRLGIILLTSTILPVVVGAKPAGAWAVLSILVWFWDWQATHLIGRQVRIRAVVRLNFVGSVVAATACWSGLAALYWLHGGEICKIVAVTIIFGQMAHAQLLAYRCRLILALNFGISAAVLLSLVIWASGYSVLQQAFLILVLSLLAGYVLVGAANNRSVDQALRTAERQAIAANEAKSAFFAMASHEMRTPLNGMLGMARAMQMGQLPAGIASKVSIMVRSGDGLLAILNDILDFSKIEAGKLDLHPQPFDLDAQCRDVAALWRETAQSKGLYLTYEIKAGLVTLLMGDGLRVRQILLNLVSNAVKFTETGGVRVTVETSDPAPTGLVRVRVGVTDTGIGLSPGQIARLFDDFAQADASTAARFGGTGLGLSICRKLATLMGGRVLAKSAPGQGSTFTLVVDLPVAPVAPVSVPPPAEASENAFETDLSGLRILVVDDHPMNLAVASAILKALGAETLTAYNGRDALARLQAEACDLVLMDVHMPVMGGVEAVKRLRAGEGGRASLPVIALTGESDGLAGRRLLAQGFDAVEPKPIAPSSLVNAVLACIARDRARPAFLTPIL